GVDVLCPQPAAGQGFGSQYSAGPSHERGAVGTQSWFSPALVRAGLVRGSLREVAETDRSPGPSLQGILPDQEIHSPTPRTTRAENGCCGTDGGQVRADPSA